MIFNQMARNLSAGYTSSNSSSVDEGLYLLQQHCLFDNEQRKVLVCGSGGLGVKVVKRIIPQGVQKITVHNKDFQKQDLSSVYKRISEENIDFHSGVLTEDFISKFKVIVLTDSSLEEQHRIGRFAHNHGIALIIADTKGLFGQIFCDFGEQFIVYQGEKSLSAKIGHITKEEHAVVTCLNDHGFKDNDYVTFMDVEGMESLNNCEPWKIKVYDTKCFEIGDTRNFKEYTSGGIAMVVNIETVLEFKCFSDAIKEPQIIVSHLTKIRRRRQLHLLFQSMHIFKEKYGRLPAPLNEDDAEEVFSIVKTLNENINENNPTILNKAFITEFCFIAKKYVSGMQDLVSKVVADEVKKAYVPCCLSLPIHQYMYIDGMKYLPGDRYVEKFEFLDCCKLHAVKHCNYPDCVKRWLKERHVYFPPGVPISVSDVSKCCGALTENPDLTDLNLQK